jgi:hypothetical protein
VRFKRVIGAGLIDELAQMLLSFSNINLGPETFYQLKLPIVVFFFKSSPIGAASW